VSTSGRRRELRLAHPQLHAVGASCLLAVYIHIGRGLYYGSYKGAARGCGSSACSILLLMMATRFHGLLAALGPMTFWR